MDWIEGDYTTLSVSFLGRVEAGVATWNDGIYRLTWISDHQFNMIADGKTYSGGTAVLIIKGGTENFNAVAVDSSTIRSRITWCLEFVDGFSD